MTLSNHHMGRFNLTLPDDHHHLVAQLAEQDGVSMAEWIRTAVAIRLAHVAASRAAMTPPPQDPTPPS